MNDKELRDFAKMIFGEDIFCPVEKPARGVVYGFNNDNYVKANKPATPKPPVKDNKFEIQTILANKKKGVFTVVWMDGTNTMIHIQDGDTWDDEKALAMCFIKKLYENKGKFNDIFTKVMPEKIKYIGTRDEVEVKSTRKVAEVAEVAQKATTATVNATTAFSEMAKAVGKKRV